MSITSEQIQEAIDAGIIKVLEGGQEYQLADGSRVRRADLDKLLKAKAELAGQTAAESDGLVMFQGPLGFGRP